MNLSRLHNYIRITYVGLPLHLHDLYGLAYLHQHHELLLAN